MSTPPRDVPTNRRGDGWLWVRFYRDGEEFRGRYRDRQGRYDDKALQRLSHLLRCRGERSALRQFDPRVFEVIDSIQDHAGCQTRRQKRSCRSRAVYIVSGHRDAAYEQRRAQRGGEVHENGYHPQALAVDLLLHRVDPEEIGWFARRLKVGGVGVYPDWVHVDLGEPGRFWREGVAQSIKLARLAHPESSGKRREDRQASSK